SDELVFVAVADVSGGGKPDVVTATPDPVKANYDTDDASVLLGNGDGSFQPERRFAVGDGPEFVAVADVNRDGKPDLVTANFSSDDVSVLLGNRDGSFHPHRPFPPRHRPPPPPP